jgi:hypothetical protein
MKYSSHWIICLDADLLDTANSLRAKRGLSGDSDKVVVVRSLSLSERSTPVDALSKSFPEVPFDHNTLITILGHGDSGSTSISNRCITAKHLAACLAIWLGGVKVRRVSLHMCYGGGNRGSAFGHNESQFTVTPGRSFAARLASFCGQLVESITARTDVTRTVEHSTQYSNGTKVLTGVTRTVGPTQTDSFGRTIFSGRHHGIGDKVVFETNHRGTIENPEPASKSYFTWK